MVALNTRNGGSSLRSARQGAKPALVINRLAATFKVLGDPTRTRIVLALSKNELCVGDIAALLGLSMSAVSHQLRILRNLELVKVRKDGKMVYYSLDDEHIENLFAEGLRHVGG
ncbi:MAG: metalloregulator ArsR/SmtB family transcription factor [Actinobacteria bacterium]|nr:metalloregulator ArsR/SmtB family transcription factor [Actinomycetota bacterium]MCL5025215.1 metalloregulator ArsR/SmtB family transcription factor [Chloroflexota bacterium]